MSFASDTKSQLCKIENETSANLTAECYGMLVFAKKFSVSEICMSTENEAVARRLCNMLAESMGVIPYMTSGRTNKKTGTSLFTITIPDDNDKTKINETLGHTGKELNLRINKAILDGDALASDFLRGAFLNCGSVSDPYNDYHMEFVVPYLNLAKDLCNVIKTACDGVTEKPVNASIVNRKGSFVVYIKDKDSIAEILALMGAHNANIEFVQAIIQKDIMNKANRITNSEIANLNKTAAAAATQLHCIEIIRDSIGLEMLPDELKELAILRLENPEMSLKELGENLTPRLSRSGVNHRLEKLKSISAECEASK